MYLEKQRIVEDFLKKIEPNYNNSLDKFRSNKIDNEAIYTISGFVSYVMTCSPTGMRINSGPLQGTLKTTAELLDQIGKIPKAPPELGGKSISELLESGEVKLAINKKYPQAIGISNIINLAMSFGNFAWEIIINKHDLCPFMTSDYPIAIETTRDLRIVNRIVPLAPDISIRIIPDLERSRSKKHPPFSKFRSRLKYASRSEVVDINRLIVMSAENNVYYRDDSDGIRKFISKYRDYRIDNENIHLRSNDGALQISRHRIVPFKSK